jgi:hypothetical protein
MATPQVSFSPQDIDDLKQIQQSLPNDHPVSQKITAALRAQNEPRLATAAKSPAQPGFLETVGSELGGMAKGLWHAASDPPSGGVEKALSLGGGGAPLVAAKRMFVDPQIEQGKQARASFGNGDYSQAAGHLLAAYTPMLGPMAAHVGEQTGAQLGAGNYGGAAGTVVANALPFAAGAAIPKLPGAVRAAGDYLRPSPSPDIVPPSEIHANSLAQSILPPGGIKPEFLKSIQSEVPAVRAFAQRTGNPLKTQAEGLKASQGVAQEGLQHYNEHILGPYQDERVDIPSGKSELGTTASIKQVNDRITELNHLLDTSKAESEGTVLDKISQQKYKGELGDLRTRLYDALSEKSGIPADQIKNLRESYGGEFSLANNLEAAKNARLTRTGKGAQGQSGLGVEPPTIWNMPDRIWKGLRGGEDAIADRQFARRIQKFTAAEPLRPMPNPPPSGIAAPGDGPIPPRSTAPYQPSPSELPKAVRASNQQPPPRGKIDLGDPSDKPWEEYPMTAREWKQKR